MKILTKTIESKGGNKYRIYANTIFSKSDIRVTVKIRRWFLWIIPYWVYLRDKPVFSEIRGGKMEFNDYTSAFKYINQIEAINI